jgi:hypothetical protein
MRKKGMKAIHGKLAIQAIKPYRLVVRLIGEGSQLKEPVVVLPSFTATKPAAFCHVDQLGPTAAHKIQDPSTSVEDTLDAGVDGLLRRMRRYPPMRN